MIGSAHFSSNAPVFFGRQVPEKGWIVGYAAIIAKLELKVPMVRQITMVCEQNKNYEHPEWLVFSSSYMPDDNLQMNEIEALYKHLVFALKYEGINLLVFKFLTYHYSENQLKELVEIEPTGQYSRRIWFLIEWLSGKKLNGKEDLKKKSYVALVDEKLQYGVLGEKSSRHLVINNLPGTPDFCPMIKKTKILEEFIRNDYSEKCKVYLHGLRKDLMQRAASFLLLKDSKASFTIEGESPKSQRAARWGQVIAGAGTRELSIEEIIRLQKEVIENPRFVEMGIRKKGGFVGEHDRATGEPLPDHISAKWEDLESLLNGLLKTNSILQDNNFDPVLGATVIAFGFVFIHPLEDGNGRIHRYLIHHFLAKRKFSSEGIVFPVSTAILDNIVKYKEVLEAYSHPILDFIQWKETDDHNVEVQNQTSDYYRYFDLTLHAEFLYRCIADTLNRIIPEEINYLANYDEFKKIIEGKYEMTDRKIALLVKFLEQNKGKLSKRAKDKEFQLLVENEVQEIEEIYSEIFFEK
jgi:Fic family protein